MTREAFISQLEAAIQCVPGTLKPAVLLPDVGWDSLAELSFIALADKSLGLRVGAHQVSSCQTVGDLLNLVEQSFER